MENTEIYFKDFPTRAGNCLFSLQNEVSPQIFHLHSLGAVTVCRPPVTLLAVFRCCFPEFELPLVGSAQNQWSQSPPTPLVGCAEAGVVPGWAARRRAQMSIGGKLFSSENSFSELQTSGGCCRALERASWWPRCLKALQEGQLCRAATRPHTRKALRAQGWWAAIAPQQSRAGRSVFRKCGRGKLLLFSLESCKCLWQSLP